MKIIHFFPKLLALTAILLLVFRSLIVADASWDSLSYHLPFSAMRAGMLSQKDFVFPEHLSASYLGFPSAIYYVKGFLWSVTNRAESTQLVSILSLIIFLLYAKKTLQLPAEWLTIGVLAIPTIQIGASGNMTDVPANVGMAMMFLSIYKLVTKISQINKSDLLWLAIACLIASGSKPQAVVVGGVLFAGYVVTFVLLIKAGCVKYDAQLSKKAAVSGLAFCGILVSYPALINVFNYGNPIYPMQLNLAGLHLNGMYQSSNWSDPQYLNSLPQQVRWLLSVLELHAYDLRPIPYTIDQGSVPLVAKSFRMGGYFSPLVLMSLFVIVLLAIKRWRYDFAKGLVLFIIVTIFISSLPGSNELRYYSFWSIAIVAMAIEQLESNKNDFEIKGVLLLYKAFLLICFTFVVFITGGEYFKIQGVTYAELGNGFVRERKIIHSGVGNTFCYEGDFRGAIFDSSVFSNSSNVVLINGNNAACRGGQGE